MFIMKTLNFSSKETRNKIRNMLGFVEFGVVAMMLTFSNGEEIVLTCEENFKLLTVKKSSMAHIGLGDFLVSVCCPISHQHAEFFGREGVGCCKVSGQRCVFNCKCKDNSKPMRSKTPKEKLILRKKRHVIIQDNGKGHPEKQNGHYSGKQSKHLSRKDEKNIRKSQPKREEKNEAGKEKITDPEKHQIKKQSKHFPIVGVNKFGKKKSRAFKKYLKRFIRQMMKKNQQSFMRNIMSAF